MDRELDPVTQAKGLAKFVSVDITIKVLGHVILHYHWPPERS